MLESVAVFLTEVVGLQREADFQQHVTLAIATPKPEVGGVQNLQHV